MSSLCRAKLSMNSMIVTSKFSRSSPVIRETVHLVIEKSLVRDSSFSVRSNLSSADSSRSSLRIRFRIGEYSSSLPGYSGFGTQNFSSLSPVRSTCIRALMYVTTSSWSVNMFSAAMSTGRIIFLSSSFRICSSAFGVGIYCVGKIRCVCGFDSHCFVSGGIYCRGQDEFHTLVKMW